MINEAKLKVLFNKWYEKGVEVGKMDTVFNVEEHMEETLQDTDASTLKYIEELFWYTTDSLEETDEFMKLVGAKIVEEAWNLDDGDGTFDDIYFDSYPVRSEFWEGYRQGRLEVGIDLLAVAKSIAKKYELNLPSIKEQKISSNNAENQ